MNILHIETRKLIRNAARDIIESMELCYYPATTMEEAFTILRKEKIQLIIICLEMEDASGVDLVTEISCSDYSKIPIVVLTENDSLEIRKKLFDLGVVDYQIKRHFTKNHMKNYIETIQLSDELIERLRSFRIAVIDDSVLTINVIRNIFTLIKVENVDYFYDAKTLLESELDYNVYIVDLVLPETSGEELIYQLNEHDNIIILISSTSNYKTISHILNAGASDFIVKPFDVNTFIIRIKSHIRTYLLLKELEEKNQKLLELSVTDGLTRVYNHRYIVQKLKDEVFRADRYDHDLAIILIDLDNFKSVNDTYGHQVGDEVLIKIASTIGNHLREGDTLGRYGGEEFLVVLPETNIEQAKNVGEKLRNAIEKITYETKGLNTTISGGVAYYQHFDYSAMIKQADINLYCAKGKGKNQII